MTAAEATIRFGDEQYMAGYHDALRHCADRVGAALATTPEPT